MKKTVTALALSLVCSVGAYADQGFIDRGPTSGWTELGSGEYYDGLVCDVFTGLTAGEHWTVKMQHNPEHPGWYRFLPFDGEWPGVDIAGESQIYMIINASNPDKVYMCDTDKILLVSGWQYIFSQDVPENLENGAKYATLRDGVIEFPANSFLFYKCSPAASWDRTQMQTVNRTGSLKVVLPKSSGIVSVLPGSDAEEAPEYYNLQGMKVDNPACGIYLRKSGKEIHKVLIK